MGYPQDIIWTRFKVTGGTSRFPMDMPRFDQCFPRTEQDANTAQREDLERRTVELVHIGDRRHWEPNAARWASFLWQVDESSIIQE